MTNHNKTFIKIAITCEKNCKNEHERIENLLKNREVDFVHIRKPNFSEKELYDYLKKFNENIFPFFKLHDHFELLNHFNIGGVHLNSRNRIFPERKTSLSVSLHNLEFPENFEDFDYMFLSPVFDSISKKGYKSRFNPEELKTHIEGKRIIALGGITPDKFEFLKKCGFYGAALLGYYWN